MYTVQDVDQYLYRTLGFSGGETDDLIVSNQSLIDKMLAEGNTPAQIADELDCSTITNAEK